MTRVLTPAQQEFLDRLLLVRPQTRARLGGRKLGKIRDRFTDYLRRRRKTEEAIQALEQAFGAGQGQALRQSLDNCCAVVDAGAETGDETVFDAAYAQLEEVKRDARRAGERLVAQTAEVDSASRKFEEVLNRVLHAPAGRRAALARSVTDSCVQWLSRHQGCVAPRINQVMEQALALSDLPLSRHQGLALGTHLGNEVDVLCREIEGLVARDRYVLADEVRNYDSRMASLALRLGSALAEAHKSGSIVAVHQIRRASAQLNRTRLRVSPPPLPDPGSPSRSGGPVALLEARLEDLSDAQRAERAVLRADAVLGHAREELQRIQAGMAQAEPGLRAARAHPAPAAVVLADDIELVADSLTDASAALLDAEDRIADADQQLVLGRADKDRPGAWQEALDLVAMACDMALARLSAADSALGRAEGGVAYLRGKVGAFDSIPRRIAALDNGHLNRVLANIAVLADCDRVPRTAGNVDLLRHLVMVSADAEHSRTCLAGIRNVPGYGAQVQALMASPKLGTRLVTQLVQDCHAIVGDGMRYLGSTGACRNWLDPSLHALFDLVLRVARQDVARFTVPVVLRPEGPDALLSVGVAVVGGGPIGLLAAIEARMAGAAHVHVYEGRQDPYSRMNVVALDVATLQRFRGAGVYETLFPEAPEAIAGASIRTIEQALEQRCNTLGIALERDRFLLDVRRDGNGVVNLLFKGDPTPRTCDLLIVATGASVASAQKHADNLVLGDKLGIPFQKSVVKDYALTGLLDRSAAAPAMKKYGDRDGLDGWSYHYMTDEVKYLVAQLTEEEFRDMGENPRKLVERVQRLAEATCQAPRQALAERAIDPSETADTDAAGLEAALGLAWSHLQQDFHGIDNFYGRAKAQDDRTIDRCLAGARTQLSRTIAARTARGEGGRVSAQEVESSLMNLLLGEFGVSRFPIEMQQARGFASADGGAVLIGNAAATPHPATAAGLNMGVAEMSAVRDLIQDLQRGSDEARHREALQTYDFELKRLTDTIVSVTLDKLQNLTRTRINRVCMQRILPQLAQWRDGREWGASVFLGLVDGRVKSGALTDAQSKDDRDWSRREARIQELRGLLDRVEAVAAELVVQNTVLLQARLTPVDEVLPAALKASIENALRD